MNSDIIVIGPTEVLTDTAVVENKQILQATALGDCALTGVTFIHPPGTPNANAVSAFTLTNGNTLENVAGLTLTTGKLKVVYKGK